MKDFYEWLEDTEEYMLWIYANDYEDKSDYAKKRLLYELKICSDFSVAHKKEIQWYSFKFIPI